LENSLQADTIGGDLKSTPLQWAAREGHLQVVELLHQHGANWDFRDSQGYNSLHVAIHGKKPEMLLLLLALGGNINSKDSYGRTPLMWACYGGDNYDLITILIEWGADLNIQDVTGYTALHWAVVSSNFHCGKDLIQAGALQDIVDEKNKTAKDWARERQWESQYDKMIPSSGIGWFTKSQAGRIMYFLPFCVLPIYLYVFGYYSLVFALPFLLITGFLATQFIERVLTNGDSEQLMNSPVLTSLLQSLMLWTFFTWISIFPCIGHCLII
jgi:hypothetical protein